MVLSEEDRKYILNEHLRNISRIADKKYQTRIWIRGEGPEVDDFDETVCHFFDDGDPILKSYKEYNISEEQHRLMMELRSNFEAFSDQNDLPEEFIDSLAWKEIMEMAREVLKAFHFRGGFA